MGAFTVRPMAHGDLKAAAEVTNGAFAALTERPAEPRFSLSFFELRFAADPRGCFVALDETGSLLGSLFSVARGPLGWFGPLAVRPEVQKTGIGEALVAECLTGWTKRDITLAGLETFAGSCFHVQF